MGKPLEKLQILKEWELTEKNMLTKFLDLFMDNWNFVPIGQNLHFDFNWLIQRAKIVLDKEIPYRWLFCEKPYIDIKPILIIWNRGNFRMSGLHNLLDEEDGAKIAEWYRQRDYKQIIEYVTKEAETFIKVYQNLKAQIPKISPLYT